MAKHTGPHIWCVDGCARTFFFPEAGQLLAGGVPLPDVTPDFDATLTHKHSWLRPAVLRLVSCMKLDEERPVHVCICAESSVTHQYSFISLPLSALFPILALLDINTSKQAATRSRLEAHFNLHFTSLHSAHRDLFPSSLNINFKNSLIIFTSTYRLEPNRLVLDCYHEVVFNVQVRKRRNVHAYSAMSAYAIYPEMEGYNSPRVPNALRLQVTMTVPESR